MSPHRRIGARLGRTLGVAAGGALLWATAIEPRLFTIRRHTLPVLPAGAAPMRVLHLSDLHLAPWQHRKVAWVRRLAELHPDLLVLTGDLMGHRAARGPLLHALQPLAAAAPGVFVHGSNDYYGPMWKNPVKYLLEPSRKSTRRPDLNTAALTRGLTEELGFADLNNSAARLTVRGTELDLFGLADPHIKKYRPDTMRTELDRVRRECGDADTSSSSAVPLGVVHAPYQDALGALLDAGAATIFAGHTHGGQVRVPGVGALTSNCDLPLAQARGLSVWYDAERAAFLSVSAGLGASIYAPIRFACRPEASLLTLVARDD